MRQRAFRIRVVLVMEIIVAFLCWTEGACVAATGAQDAATAQIRVETPHPWRPPFGLERIGQPLTVVVEIADERQPVPELAVVGYAEGNEVARSVLALSGKPPYVCRISLDPRTAELVLISKSAAGAVVELARQAVEQAPLEADAVARPERVINPVDLGAILVPSDWLLLGDGQKGSVDVAAVHYREDMPDARVTVWFESAPDAKATADMPLAKGNRAQVSMPLPASPPKVERDFVHVSITRADGVEVWNKKIPAMLVHTPPKWPEFGAVETKLRYDAPISVRNADGTFSSMDYADGWDSKLQDVVVALPNGSRFVFWRGSSYIPFWAGQYNAGLCYEWAENTPPPDGVDCVEPLMDKELRYGRVRIVESTSARVHVRWDYQSCDFNYKVWGDLAAEDYYFYPDGFGTRVLTIQMDPASDYELSEFIVLTPQSTYPLSIFPSDMMDMLFIDGEKRELSCPFLPNKQEEEKKPRGIPAIHRIRMHKDEPMAGIYFCPLDITMPHTFYPPFFDKGELVTPFYWGSHWPLARGNSTGWAIDDRVTLTPCHNSIVSWAKNRPEPLRTSRLETLDSLGRVKPMVRQTWAWLIGMTDADDARLLQWAKSFSAPPALELQGARFDSEPYSPERRAIGLVAEDRSITIQIKPATVCVNPVFELSGAPKSLDRVQLSGRTLEPHEYAWDGRVLWVRATVTHAVSLALEFSDTES